MNRAINASKKSSRKVRFSLNESLTKFPGYYDRIANFRDKVEDRRHSQLLACRKGKYFSFPFLVREAQQIFISSESINLRKKNDDTGSSAATLADDGLRSFASAYAASLSRRDYLTFIVKLWYHLAFIKPSSVFGEYSSVSLCQCHSIVPSW